MPSYLPVLASAPEASQLSFEGVVNLEVLDLMLDLKLSCASKLIMVSDLTISYVVL